jgi:hypothetical protein
MMAMGFGHVMSDVHAQHLQRGSIYYNTRPSRLINHVVYHCV